MSAIPTFNSRLSVQQFALRVGTWLATSLPAWLVAAAGMVAGIDALALHLGLLSPLPSLLPIDPDLSEPVVASAAAIGLVGLAIGLARCKRVAWWLAVAVLAAALLDQIELLRHVVPALLAAVCLALLIVTRGRYQVETGTRSRRLAFLLCGVGAFLAVASLGVSIGTALGLVSPATDARDLGGALLDWVAFGNPDLAVQAHLRGGLLLAVTATARVALAGGLIFALAPGEVPPSNEEGDRQATSVADRYGQGGLLPFQLGHDTERFTAPGRDALVAYGLDGRVAVILGDPIGLPEHAQQTLYDFLATCPRRDWIPAVYQASSIGLVPLQALGYLSYHIGREAIVDLETFDLSGARRSNLRHTVTRARHGGVTVAWHPNGLGAGLAGLGDELLAVETAWRQRARASLRFTVSSYQPSDLVTNPVAIAQEPDGRIVAFTTFRPAGRDNGWVLDLLRRVPGSVPGAVESCLVEAAFGLRSLGASTLSLGLAPLAGLDPRQGSPVERVLGLGVRMVRHTYDVAGLYFFKAKFDPRWEPRYLVVARRAHLPSVILALLRLHLGGSRGLLWAGWHLRAAD